MPKDPVATQAAAQEIAARVAAARQVVSDKYDGTLTHQDHRPGVRGQDPRHSGRQLGSPADLAAVNPRTNLFCARGAAEQAELAAELHHVAACQPEQLMLKLMNNTVNAQRSQYNRDVILTASPARSAHHALRPPAARPRSCRGRAARRRTGPSPPRTCCTRRRSSPSSAGRWMSTPGTAPTGCSPSTTTSRTP